MEVNYLDLVGEGYMGSMQWQLGREMGTIPVFASRTQENQENLGRDGWWMSLTHPPTTFPLQSVLTVAAYRQATRTLAESDGTIRCLYTTMSS